MSNKKEILMESIDILIAERLKQLKFNNSIQVNISTVNIDGTYDVLYHKQTITNVKAREGTSFIVGDVCWALIPNNEFSLLFLDCKIP